MIANYQQNILISKSWNSYANLQILGLIKLFFNFINKKIGRLKQKIEIKDLKTKEILKDHETAGLFANFFKPVYSNENGKVPILQNNNTQINDDIVFTSDSIEQTLNKLPNKYSAGPDGIPTILLKKLSPKISLPLTILFQSSLNQGIIPTDWK